jgi:HK97 gp10 family phage protein
MGKMNITLPEDFMRKLEGLGERVDDVVSSALQAGGEVVKAAVATRLPQSIGRTKYPSRSTGTLQSSLGVSPVKVRGDGGLDVHVGFSKPRRGGGSNAMLANILEHGKSGQPARPFLKPAKSASKAAAEAAMKAVIEKELGNL